jgi:iron complex outermembrane receptor protein
MKYRMLMASCASLTALCSASLAHAQEANVAAASDAGVSAEAAVGDEDAIVVSGIRAALQSAESRKRDAEVVIDGISADDIGLLPDVSISESLTRIPGVTANDTARGSDQVAIRGLGPDLASTEYNGRILPTADGVNRRVGLGGLPSEGLSGAFVQKTPDGGTIEGGVSGILALESIRPLESKRKGLTVVVRGLFEEQANDFRSASATKPFGLRGEVTYVGKLADNLGISLTYAGIKDQNVQTGVQLESWRLDSSTRVVSPAAPPGRPLAITQPGARYDINGDGVADSLPSNAGSIIQMLNTERHSALGMIQWEPTDWLTVSLDGLFSEETRSGETRRFFAIDLFNGALGAPTSATVENDTVTQFAGTSALYRGVINAEKVKDHTYGGGVNFAVDDGGALKARFDFSWAEAGRDRFTPVVNFDNDANTALPVAQQAPSQRQAFGYDVRDRGNVVLDFGALSADDFAIQQINTTKQDSLDRIKAARADFVYEIDGGFLRSIEWGLRYDNRFHSQRVDQTQYQFLATGALPGQTALANRPDLTAAMLELQQNPFAGSAGVGGASAVAYPYYDFDTLYALGTTASNVTILDLFAQDAGAANEIEEDSFALYGQSKFGTGRLTGNIGVRWVLTDSVSRGRIATSATAARDVSVSNSYNYFLPSLNLRWEAAPDFQVRLGAARTMSRPLFEQLRSGSGVDLSGIGEGVINVTTGNPNLRPFTADGVDLGVEWFPDKGTSIAIAGYYKWVKNFTTSATETGTITLPDGTVRDANYTRFFNDPETRYFRGVEVQFRKDFDFLPGFLANFGVQANYNYNETNARESFISLAGPASFAINTTGTAAGVTSIPVATTTDVLPINLSQHVVNAIAYYDTPTFNFRLAYRYYSGYSRRFANGYQYQPDGQLDFNFGVKLLDNVRVIGTVTNILGSSLYRATADSRDASNRNMLQYYGSRGRDYALGVRVQF